MSQQPGASLVRATLWMHEPPTSFLMAIGGNIGTVNFQFNPKELTITRGANWHMAHSVGYRLGAIPRFTGAQPARMEVPIFLDSTMPGSTGTVQQQVDMLMECCEVYLPSLLTKRPSPPWVRMSWGSFSAVQFIAYVNHVSATYTLFSPTGEPTRATVRLSLTEIPLITGGQNPTSGALTARRMHQVVAGDTLMSLSYREYGDATLWRVIAEANDIDDPMSLEPGTELLLPAAEDVQR